MTARSGAPPIKGAAPVVSGSGEVERLGGGFDVSTVPVGNLDWSHPSHWNHGRREPCRHCGRPSFLLDDNGLPCHKACAEAVA